MENPTISVKESTLLLLKDLKREEGTKSLDELIEKLNFLRILANSFPPASLGIFY
jgi:hypothetical protein